VGEVSIPNLRYLLESILLDGLLTAMLHQGPVWMIGTACKAFLLLLIPPEIDPISAEHHTLYNYQLVGANNHYIGLLQVETVSVTYAVSMKLLNVL
jgi:hypothetical protein